MRVLVTGAAGFIGFHLAKKLIENKISVYAIDNLNNYYDVNIKKKRVKILYKIAKKNKVFFRLSKIDLSDKNKIKKIKKNKFNVIINLAAQAGVRYSLKNPHSYVKSNVEGFLNILELAREIRNPILIYASTSSVYGGSKDIPFNEKNSAVHPLQLYAATKRSNELMAHAYSYLFGINTIGLRFFTVYGPWSRPDMSLYTFAKNIIDGKSIKIFNKGNHIRDFTYVDDIVGAMYKLIITHKFKKYKIQKTINTDNPSSSSAPFEIFNIGNNRPTKLMYYIDLIEKGLRKKAKKKFLNFQKGDIKDTHADVNKLVKKIKYKPSTSVEKGVKNFCDWFLDYYKKRKND
ncbi:GDP-mannose 4,6-dehydratase [Candidatus Pelagibacter sp.]|nr:GDP-mannose 4,6-dehydratase [Candidatus Pelagibacter sp.]